MKFMTKGLYIKFILVVLTLSIIIFPASLIAKAEDKKNFLFAVMPEIPAVTVHKIWTPFVEKLSKETGIDIQLKVYETFPQFEDDLFHGVPDFVFLCPFYVTMAKKKQGYIPLIRNESPLECILVVRKDRDIKSTADLNGKEIAFPTPNNFAASLYIRKLLTEEEKIHFIPVYVGTHSNVYRNVILGKTEAGGGANVSFNKEPEEVRAQLRIIYRTPLSSPHPLVAHPRIPKDLSQTVIEAILRLAGDKNNYEMLSAIRIDNPLKADYRKDYELLEKLGLEKYCLLSGAP